MHQKDNTLGSLPGISITKVKTGEVVGRLVTQCTTDFGTMLTTRLAESLLHLVRSASKVRFNNSVISLSDVQCKPKLGYAGTLLAQVSGVRISVLSLADVGCPADKIGALNVLVCHGAGGLFDVEIVYLSATELEERLDLFNQNGDWAWCFHDHPSYEKLSINKPDDLCASILAGLMPDDINSPGLYITST